MSKLIAVTGANGWIGREVCGWLEGQGYGVKRLTRTGGSPGSAFLDLTMEEKAPQWLEALHGCTAVVHCAAHVHRPLETEVERILFERVNVGGTKRLLATCASAGISRFVLPSTSAVYDWSTGRAMTEDCAARPTSAYAVSKLQAENLVRATGLDWRIARLATVFGAGDTANFWRLARTLKSRRFLIPGKGDARKSVLTADRAAEMLGRLATQDASGQGIVNLGAPTAPTLRRICEVFSRYCGFASAPTAPVWLLRIGAWLGDAALVLGLPAKLNTDTLNKLTTSTVLDVTKMRHMFPDLNWLDFDEELARAARYYAAG
jgi:nucleoside-diphosphate-sugar epimerase